jgi:large subunit ribosomal protein L14e
LSGDAPELGTVVLSRAGRDKGRYFVVVGRVDAEYVLLCDGGLRKLQNPKKKKIKHIDVKPVTLPAAREKLERGSGLYDAEIRHGLEALGYAPGAGRPAGTEEG